jgi:hypothetical protein
LSQSDLHPCPDEGRNGYGPRVLSPRRPGSEDHEPPPPRDEGGHLTALIGLSCLVGVALLAFIAVVIVLLRR